MAIQTAADNQVTVLSASWNSAATAYTAFKLDVNNILTPSTSKLFDVGTNTGTYSSRFSIDVSGSMTSVGSMLLGTTRQLQLYPDYGGSGELLAGAYISSVGNNAIFMIPSSNGFTGAAATAGIGYYNGTGWYSALQVSNVASGFGDLLLMRSGGSVGIGTNSPATKFSVFSGAVSANYGVFSGSLAAYVSPTGALYTYWNTTSNFGTIASVADNSGTAAPLQLRVGGTLSTHIDTSGRVIIGNATSPSAASILSSVVGGGNGYTTWYASSGNAGGAVGTAGSTNSLEFYTAAGTWGSESYSLRMFINSSGNVGIGTNTTTSRLLVSGSSTATTPTMIVREGVVSPTGGALAFEVENSAGGTILAVTGSGLVGINTAVPNAQLAVYNASLPTFTLHNSSNYTRLASSGNDFYIDTGLGGTAGATIFRRGSGTAEHVRFDSSGNVGIGSATITAGTKLFVYTTQNDASSTPSFDFHGAFMRIGDYTTNLAFTNGVGLKIHDGGVVHYSVGQIGGKLVISDTSNDGNQLFPAARSDVASFSSTLVALTGSVQPGTDNLYDMGSATKRWRNVYATALSGSLTRLADGSSYLIAGPNVTITTGSNGAVTIQASLAGGTVSGTGTVNYVPKWNGTTSLANSTIFDNGNYVGIGTTTGLANALEVYGDVNLSLTGSLKVGAVKVINTTNSNGSDIYVNARVVRNESSTNTDGLYLGYGNSGTTTGHIRFFANGTNERMKIAADTGAVIVSDLPNAVSSTTARLFVSGSSTSAHAAALIKGGITNSTGPLLEVQTALGATQFIVSSSGNVGVGTGIPTQKFEVVGTSGSLFSVSDSLSGSLFSVNTISGLPILEVFSDNTVVAGAYNTNALVVTGSRVGIGTNNPDARLVISGGLGNIRIGEVFPAYNGITLNGSTSQNDYNILSRPTDQTLYVNRPSGQAIQFREANTNQIIFTTGGNVGIGTQTVGSGNGLSVYRGSATNAFISSAGNANTPGSTDAIFGQDASSIMYVWNRANADLILGSNNLERARFFSTGNISFGTSTSAARFLVSGSSTASTPTMIVREGVVSPVGGALAFEVENSAGTTIFAVSGSGNVGIGTADIKEKLQVYGDLKVGVLAAGSFISLADESSTARYVGIYRSAGDTLLGLGAWGGIKFHASNTNLGSQTEWMRLDTSGRLGIGVTNPTNILTINKGNGTGINVQYDNSTNVRTGLFLFTRGSSIGGFSGGSEWDDSTTTARSTAASSLLASAGTLLFYTNSGLTSGNTFTPSERMRIDTSGNVGIGTNNPGNLLTVNQASNTTGGTTTSYGFMLNNQGSARLSIGNDGTNSLIQSWNSNPLVINAQGNNISLGGSAAGPNTAVGVGTPNARLHVQGSTTTTTPTLLVRENQAMATATAALDVQNSSSTSLFFVSGSGRVGIGSNSLVASGLTIADVSNLNNIARLNLRNDNSDVGNRLATIGYNSNAIQLYTAAESTGTANNTLALFQYNNAIFYTGTTATNPSERMRIDSSGNVGIGVTTPPSLLSIDSASSHTTNDLVFTFDSAGNYRNGISNNMNSGNLDGNKMMFNVCNTSTTVSNLVMTLTGRSRVGIGDTAPAYKFVVGQGETTQTGQMFIAAQLNSSGKGLVIDTNTRTTADNAVLALEVINNVGGNTLAATVAGNVGIGTTNPQARLFVSGSSTAATPTATVRAGHASPTSAILDVQDYLGTTILAVSASQTLAANGTASNPAYSFLGSQGMGIYRRTTNQLFNITVGGSQAMGIDSAQNVAIGVSPTSSPSARLHVLGSTTLTTPTVLIKESQSMANATATLDVQNAAGTSILFVSGSGNVGIGTASPDIRLNVYTTNANGVDGLRVFGGLVPNNVRIRPAMTAGANNNIVQAGDSGIIYDAGSQDTGAFVIAPWSSSATGVGIRMSATGRVGIGTSPISTLDVNGTINTTSGFQISSAATNGQYLRGNGSNFVSSAIQAGDVPTLNQNTTGQAGSVANAVTFDNSGTGAVSGTTYNGSAARTISYNTVGAPSTGGTNATGTWGISVTGNAGTATALQTSRTLWGQSFSGTGNVTGTLSTVDGITGTSGVTLNISSTAATLSISAAGSNFMTLNTNSTERMRVAADGLVSIPGYTGIGGSATSTVVLSVTGGASTGSDTTLRVRHGVANGASLPVLDVQNSASTSLLFVSGSGAVGIGTNNPGSGLSSAVNYRLEVRGSNVGSVIRDPSTGTVLQQFSNTGGNLYLGIDNSTGGYFGVGGYSRIISSDGAYPMAFFTNSSERMRITSTGDVGIGTATASGKLHVQGQTYVKGFASNVVIGSFETAFNGISLDNGSNYTILGGYTDNNLYINRPTGGDILIREGNGGAHMHIRTGGNVGVGTTNPEVKLEAFGTNAAVYVHNSGNSRGGIRAMNSQLLGFMTTAAADDLVFGYETTYPSSVSFVEVMRVDNGTSRVGIGTATPSSVLHVWTSMRYGGNNTGRLTGTGNTVTIVNSTGEIRENTSSRRFKKDIQPYNSGLNKILQLNPVSFRYTSDELMPCVGMIAEDLHDAGIFEEFLTYDAQGLPSGIRYPELAPLFINGIKELKAENDSLKSEIQTLKDQISSILATLANK